MYDVSCLPNSWFSSSRSSLSVFCFHFCCVHFCSVTATFRMRLMAQHARAHTRTHTAIAAAQCLVLCCTVLDFSFVIVWKCFSALFPSLSPSPLYLWEELLPLLPLSPSSRLVPVLSVSPAASLAGSCCAVDAVVIIWTGCFSFSSPSIHVSPPPHLCVRSCVIAVALLHLSPTCCGPPFTLYPRPIPTSLPPSECVRVGE